MDYVTSFELPFRLLLIRTPQLIAALREEWGLSQKNVVFNDKRFGCVYSLKASLSGVPDTFRYHLSHRIRRMVGNENTSSPYQQIAREVKVPRERLKYALEAGLLVTALDGGWLHSDRDDPYSSGTLWGAAAGLSTTSGHVSGSFTAGLPLVYPDWLAPDHLTVYWRVAVAF